MTTIERVITRSQKRKMKEEPPKNIKKVKFQNQDSSSSDDDEDDDSDYVPETKIESKVNAKRKSNRLNGNKPEYDGLVEDSSDEEEEESEMNDTHVSIISGMMIKQLTDNLLEKILGLEEEEDEDEEDCCRNEKKVEEVVDKELTNNEKIIKEHEDRLKGMLPMMNDYHKLKDWVDGIKKVKFGTFSEMGISITKNSAIEIRDRLVDSYNEMNSCIHGQNLAKNKLLEIIAQQITNPNSVNNAIAFIGPPGTGKTTLALDGLSKILRRPLGFISLGGAIDSSILCGHGYTYEGAVCGRIVNILKEVGCMNPIIYFDELDKVSKTYHGQEIIGILTHLIDPTQNAKFHDRYYAGIDFDLSKAIFIFSYNSSEQIDPILKDRITEIQFDSFSKNEKIKIAKDFLYPKICKNINISVGDVIITNDMLGHIINCYTKESEKGVRNVQRALTALIMKINLKHLMSESKYESYPLVLNDDMTNELLKDFVQKEDTRHLSMYI